MNLSPKQKQTHRHRGQTHRRRTDSQTQRTDSQTQRTESQTQRTNSQTQRTNSQTQRTDSQTQRTDLQLPWWGVGRGGLESGLSRRKLLHMQWTDSKALVSAQGTVFNSYDTYWKEYIYI